MQLCVCYFIISSGCARASRRRLGSDGYNSKYNRYVRTVLRPVLLGTVSQKLVFSGAIVIAAINTSRNLEGLEFEAFTMEQLFTKF